MAKARKRQKPRRGKGVFNQEFDLALFPANRFCYSGFVGGGEDSLRFLGSHLKDAFGIPSFGQRPKKGLMS